MRDPYEHYPQNRPMPHPGTGDDVHLQNVGYSENRADDPKVHIEVKSEKKVEMDTKQQWENPTETLDTVVGILTGIPVTETFGMDAIGVATDAMKEIMDLRGKLNEANRVIKEIYEGKYGVIPHPASFYMPGIWLIKKIDDYQDHAERLMSEEDFESLKATNQPCNAS